MRFPIGALVNPAANEIYLTVGHAEPRGGRGHTTGFIRCADPLKQPALRAIARHDDAVAAVFGIESEAGLPLLFVGSMTGETFVGKQGPDFAIEIDSRLGGRQRQRDQEQKS